MYEILKLVHIVSATVLFGTGLGTAFHMYMTHRGGDVRAIASASRLTVRADNLFTAPAAVVQPVTGIWLAAELGYPLLSGWVLAAILLYVLAGAFWLPVVWIQTRTARLAHVAAKEDKPLPASYFSLMRVWFWLGWPAFGAFLVIFWLMTTKPDF